MYVFFYDKRREGGRGSATGLGLHVVFQVYGCSGASVVCKRSA